MKQFDKEYSQLKKNKDKGAMTEAESLYEANERHAYLVAKLAEQNIQNYKNLPPKQWEMLSEIIK